MYLPLELEETGKGVKQGHNLTVGVQSPSEEYYTPMELNNAANHRQAHLPHQPISEEYYVEVDDEHRSAYNNGEPTEDQEYYTPMEAGIVKQRPLLPPNHLKGAKTASPLPEKKVGAKTSNLNQSTEQRERSDTVLEYANAAEWTAAQPLPSSTQRYVNFVSATKEGGKKQPTTSAKPLSTSKKPPQTTPKPAKQEELPIYGNISPKDHRNMASEQENIEFEGSEPEEEYVVPY